MRTCPSTSHDCTHRSVSILIVVVSFHILFMFLIHVISIHTICSVLGRAMARQPNIHRSPQSSLYS